LLLNPGPISGAAALLLLLQAAPVLAETTPAAVPAAPVSAARFLPAAQ
jgi:hypothetical protein